MTSIFSYIDYLLKHRCIKPFSLNAEAGGKQCIIPSHLTCFLLPLLLEKGTRYMQQNAFINISALVLKCGWVVWWALFIHPPGFVRRNESFPVQRQPSGPEGLPAQCPKLLCGGHVPVCASYSHPPLCAQVLGKDAQPLATLHSYVGAAGLWKGPQPAQQTQAEHRVLRAGEHHTTSAGNVLGFGVGSIYLFYDWSKVFEFCIVSTIDNRCTM